MTPHPWRKDLARVAVGTIAVLLVPGARGSSTASGPPRSSLRSTP